jgi:hypothetical protein
MRRLRRASLLLFGHLFEAVISCAAQLANGQQLLDDDALLR